MRKICFEYKIYVNINPNIRSVINKQLVNLHYENCSINIFYDRTFRPYLRLLVQKFIWVGLRKDFNFINA